MEKAVKYGIVGALGIAVYMYFKHSNAQTAIANQPLLPNPPTPPIIPAIPIVPTLGVSPSLALPTIADASYQGNLNDLLNWSNQTPNPTLYKQWIQGLSKADLQTLHDILVQQWDTGAPATFEHTQWWNNQVGMYPFLKSSGQGCNNLQCN